MSNPPPAPFCAAGVPFIPTSSSGSSSAHGRVRSAATISPVPCGLSVTFPPGPCPWKELPFTLRCTVRTWSVVLLTVTTNRLNRERSASPFKKSMRTPGQLFFTPVFTPTEPSASVAIEESACARISVSGPGHSTSPRAAATAAIPATTTAALKRIIACLSAASERRS